MRSKIIKIFEKSTKAFKPLTRPSDAKNDTTPKVATGLSSPTRISHAQIDNKEKFVVKKNKAGEYVLSKEVNGVEVGSHTFPNIKMLKDIIQQDTFKDSYFDYRISNQEEDFLKSKETPQAPKEAPLDLNFSSANLLNQRDSGNRTYISPEEKQIAITEVIHNVKNKLLNKQALVNDIRELKDSEVINDVAREFMNGHVFKPEIGEFANVVRYVHYLVYNELVNHFLVNDNTKILRTQSDIKRRGGDISPVIKDLAKGVLPIFERYLNRKERSELFNAFAETK
jgi:hypothetical protein